MMVLARYLCLSIFVLAYITCDAGEEDCSEIREKFNQLEKEFFKLKQHVLVLELKSEKDHRRRYLVDGELDIEYEIKKLIQDVQGIKQGMGSTYTRWGRTQCADNNSIVYRGYTGGKWYQDTGGPANYVCMPEHPQWAKYLDGFQNIGNRIYGTEYEDNSESTFNPFNVHRDDEDAPCVVCRSQRSTSIMIPARTTCYNGWYLEYTGYLMTMSRAYPSSSEYICVDKDPEAIPHGSNSVDGNLLYIVEATCGSLPCLPYVDGREIACVVCSK